jgi:hypothetical protein
MQVDQANGVRLAWLINPQDRSIVTGAIDLDGKILRPYTRYLV